MPSYWDTMAEENRQNMIVLEARIEALQAEYKQTHAQNLIKKISRIKELRDEARLNWHIYARRAAEYENRK